MLLTFVDVTQIKHRMIRNNPKRMTNCNRRPSEIVLHLLAISAFSMIVNGKLLKTLEDTVVLVNDTIRLSCRTNTSERIQFFHNGIHMYAGGILYRPWKGRFVNYTTENHTYTLVNKKAGLEDAGVYKCVDDEGRGESSSASLTVLNSRLLCESNMHANGYIGPNTCNLQQENMTFSCSASFNGTSPRLMWRASNNSLLLNSSFCDHQPNRVNCRLTLKSDPSYDGTVFTCQTAQPGGTQYNCSTEVIKVQYFALDRELKPVEKIVDEKVECSVRSNLNPGFKWSLSEDSQERVVDRNNRSHVIQESGLYWCNVSYRIGDDVQCSATASVIYARKPMEHNVASTTATSFFVVVLIVAISVCLFYIWKLKKKQWNAQKEDRKQENDAREEILRQTGRKKFLPSNEEPSYKKNWKFVSKLKDSKKPVYGIAILDGKMFSISEKESTVEVYSIKDPFTFKHIRSPRVNGLTNPKDIISCRAKECLFIKEEIERDKDGKEGDREKGDKKICQAFLE